jgi:putative transposase
MQNIENQTIKELARQCKTVEDIHDKLKEIFKDTLQEVFEAEIEQHLGYKKHSSQGDNTGNSRNGYSAKTLKTRFGNVEVDIPRDRNGEFEPQIIKKYERTSNQLEEQILAMYAKGMSTRDIEDHMKDIYGVEVSSAMVSKITDRILPMIAE